MIRHDQAVVMRRRLDAHGTSDIMELVPSRVPPPCTCWGELYTTYGEREASLLEYHLL